ncbi:MAG: GNAT family N-acetyltransferase [Pleurocapsa sp.]
MGPFSLIFLPTIIYPEFHKTAILDVVTVHSNYRGQGWGSMMIKKALKISADANCYKVTLSSSLHRDRAHKFYQSLGFKQHGFSFSYQLNH